MIEPIYLRYVHDSLSKGSLNAGNAAALPQGFIGLYEQEFTQKTPVSERKKALNQLALWALFKGPVSANFAAAVLDVEEEKMKDLIYRHSSWFNSPESGMYQLYHERLRVYLLQKLSDKEFHNLNQIINYFFEEPYTNLINEAIIYKLKYIIYHYLISNKVSDISNFLTNENTIVESKKYLPNNYFFNTLFDLAIRINARNKNKDVVLELIKIQRKFSQDNIKEIINNANLIAKREVYQYALQVSNTLDFNDKISFWWKIIVGYFSTDFDLDEINSFLNQIDKDLNYLKIISKDSNNLNFYFSFLERENFFLLVNWLLENKLEINWLINRYNWLPDYNLARDGIYYCIVDYKKDFKLLKAKYKKYYLNELIKSLEKKKLDDLYRTKDFCYSFIERLKEVSQSAHSFKYKFSDSSQKKNIEKFDKFDEYKTHSKYYRLNYYFKKITLGNKNQITSELLSESASISALISLINDLEDIKSLENEILDCLYDFCHITEGEFSDYSIQDEYWNNFEILFFIVYEKSTIKKFINFYNYIIHNFEISKWNEYLGEVGPLTSKDLGEEIINSILSIIIDDNNISFLKEHNLMKEIDIIHSICDIYKENAFAEIKRQNLQLSIEDLVLAFKENADYMFNISYFLKIDLKELFDELLKTNNLNLKHLIFFVAKGLITKEAVNLFEVSISENIKENDKNLMKSFLFEIFKNLSSVNLLSNKIIGIYIDIVDSSKEYVDLRELIKYVNDESFFYMKLRNSKRYINLFLNE